jgi:hypothetical protein
MKVYEHVKTCFHKCVEAFGRGFEQTSRLAHSAGIVNQDVEPAELFDGVGHQALAEAFMRDVVRCTHVSISHHPLPVRIERE